MVLLLVRLLVAWSSDGGVTLFCSTPLGDPIWRRLCATTTTIVGVAITYYRVSEGRGGFVVVAQKFAKTFAHTETQPSHSYPMHNRIALCCFIRICIPAAN